MSNVCCTGVASCLCWILPVAVERILMINNTVDLLVYGKADRNECIWYFTNYLYGMGREADRQRWQDCQAGSCGSNSAEPPAFSPQDWLR